MPFWDDTQESNSKNNGKPQGLKPPFVALQMPGLKPRPTSEATANATATTTTKATAIATTTAIATAIANTGILRCAQDDDK